MRKTLKIALCVFIVALAFAAAWVWMVPFATFHGEDARVHISAGSEAWADSLASALGHEYASKVEASLKVMRKTPKYGSYVVKEGTSAYAAARNLASGHQTPVKVTFNNVRLMPDLAQRICRNLDITEQDFLAACDSVLPSLGYKPSQFPAAFLPDTYEYYWNVSPGKLVRSLASWRDKWWQKDGREEKAARLGLTKAEAATLASIVEEESAKADELPKIARLYLNRLDRGMLLQADPTVKYAVGDFSLRRILNAHLKQESPYNTYIHQGLPPGPIRIASQRGIDAVLNAPAHPYIYMCAKDDFSGYHNFATSFEQHQRNARLYQQALNKKSIKK